MKTNAAAAGYRRISPVWRSLTTTAANRPRSPYELDDIHAGVDHELRVGPHPLLEERRGRQVGVGQHPDVLGELGEVQPLLEGGVAAADDDDLLGPLVEGPVTRGAEVDAGADQVVLAGDVEAPVGRTGGHDHGVGREDLAGREGGHQVVAVGLRPR